MAIHLAAGAKGPVFNSPVARAFFRFNSWDLILAGCLLVMRCMVLTNCDCVMQCS